jgi:hypothetical protein
MRIDRSSWLALLAGIVGLGSAALPHGAMIEPLAPPSPGLVCAEPAAEQDRGCCVLKTAPKASCIFTNEGYCTRKASEASVGFEFHKDTTCAEYEACR